ncbi:hypothetical protein [Alcaligenes faecalis]|uniref:hypothetical protein n=1 Tax=Alcaligenes faecalis TaxID=511 RepID=UPI000F0BBF97|nr:hypothetical protein [Alcaligenes faecalis]AYR19460.1 hypothetical protein D6I95_03205 [Alcaligenes faecalis]
MNTSPGDTMSTYQGEYQGVARDCTVTLKLRVDQSAAVLKAYDNGFDALTKEQQHQLYVVIAMMKDQIWP